MTSKFGPVSAKFSGKVTLSDLDPPNGYRITGEGQGGAAGFAKGGAEVRLEPGVTVQETVLRYTAHAAVGGKLAQIGSRLVDGAARKTADQFFARFGEIVGAAAPAAPPPPIEPGVPEAAVPPPVAPVSTAPRTPSPEPARAGLSPKVWIIALIVIVALLLAVFGLRG